MLARIKLVLATAVVAGLAFGVTADVAQAKSKKKTRGYHSAPVYLQTPSRGYYSPRYSPGFDRPSSPYAGGVG